MKKIFINCSDLTLKYERLVYVLSFINQHPLNEGYFFALKDVSQPDLSIAYGPSEGDFKIAAQQLFFTDQKVETSNLFANSYLYEGRTIYSVESKAKEPQDFLKEGVLSFDVFETIFFHISRYEEFFCNTSNNSQAGWLKEDLHFLIRHKLEQCPVVDQLVSVFLQSIGQPATVKSTTYDISHDVDILTRFSPFSKFLKSLAATIIYGRGFNQLTQSISHFNRMRSGKVHDPYDNFHYLLREESLWKDKVLYLMAGGNTKYDNKYTLQDEKLDEIIFLAIKRGYRFGLHPSYNAGFDAKLYDAEKTALERRLGEAIILNRQHWLRFDWRITTKIFSEQNIGRDASMGYNRNLGFRCGTGFPYFLYDFANEQAFEWLELPMAFMESSAIHQARNSGKSLHSLMKSFLEKNKFDTHISFNFHNSNFDPLLTTGQTLEHFYKNELIELID